MYKCGLDADLKNRTTARLLLFDFFTILDFQKIGYIRDVN